MHSGLKKTAPRYNEEIDRFLCDLEATAPNPQPNVVALGFPLTDDLLGGGLRPGELTLIAGTSNIGRSSLAANVTKNVAVINQLGVLTYSLEKTISAFMLSVLASSRNLNHDRLGREVISHPKWSELSSRNSWGTHGCIRLVDSAGIDSLPTLTASITAAGSGGFSPSLIVIDNLQLLVEGEYAAGELEKVIVELKQVAAALKAPLLLLSHVNVHTEIPFELVRLVDNGFILSETENRHELRCTKNAHGGSFTLPLQFHSDTGSFTELTAPAPHQGAGAATRAMEPQPRPLALESELAKLQEVVETHRALLTRHGHISQLDQKMKSLHEAMAFSGRAEPTHFQKKAADRLNNELASLDTELRRIIEACHLNRTFECAFNEAADAVGDLLTTAEAAKLLEIPADGVDHAMRKGGFHRIRIPYASSGYPRIFWAAADCHLLRNRTRD